MEALPAKTENTCRLIVNLIRRSPANRWKHFVLGDFDRAWRIAHFIVDMEPRIRATVAGPCVTGGYEVEMTFNALPPASESPA